MINKNELVYEDKFIRIFCIEEKPKTKRYSVWSKCSNCKLGEIRWYPPWRHYCFIIGELVFSDRCLMNIGDNVLGLNKLHKVSQIKKRTNKEV